MSRIVLVVGERDAGVRLDVALAVLPEVGSRAAAQRLIDGGRVRVDGRPRPKRHRLAPGERVTAEPASGAPLSAGPVASAEAPHEVVHEDRHLLVVDKPPGVVVHPAPGHPTGTLVQALASRGSAGGEPWRPGIVHRLDRDTSGLLVVAKSEAVHRALQGLIRSRRMSREYAALVDGRLHAVTGTIDAAIGRDRRERKVVSTRTDRPREARTHFRRLEDLPCSTLVEVHLETGRTHQIRAHFAAIGHPVLGDAAYGGAERGRLGLRRQFLHAARLSFPHPVGGDPLTLESELPDDLCKALAAARRERAAG
ncbi:MAG TPA: RluA family pseudouridine synthase [Thermoleophilaceae bacterium]|nr:RluA family pseudouridine synthase [Thermoleophilaceae bacterium]